MDAYRSILLPVVEVKDLVEPFRRDGDWSSAYGVPAHLTIAGPWPLEVLLPSDALGELAAKLRGAAFQLASMGRLGTALCLYPNSDSPLPGLRKQCLEIVGVPDQLDSRWRIHMTVLRASDRPEVETAEEALGRALPIDCEVGGLLIAKMNDPASVSLESL